MRPARLGVGFTVDPTSFLAENKYYHTVLTTKQGNAYRRGSTVEEQREQLEDVEQLAHRLQVKDSWVYAQVAHGTIPFIKIGKYLRFRRSDIEQWLREQSREIR
jgi:excisionase family DNA binding protein